MKINKIQAGVGAALALICGTAHAYIWSAAVPTEVHLVDGGLLLLGDFNNEGVTCASGPRGIFLPGTDATVRQEVSNGASCASYRAID